MYKCNRYALCGRFKQLPYATEEDKNLVATPIKEMLTKLIQEESGDNTNIKIEEEAPNKKIRLSGMYTYEISLFFTCKFSLKFKYAVIICRNGTFTWRPVFK